MLLMAHRGSGILLLTDSSARAVMRTCKSPTVEFVSEKGEKDISKEINEIGQYFLGAMKKINSY